MGVCAQFTENNWPYSLFIERQNWWPGWVELALSLRTHLSRKWWAPLIWWWWWWWQPNMDVHMHIHTLHFYFYFLSMRMPLKNESEPELMMSSCINLWIQPPYLLGDVLRLRQTQCSLTQPRNSVTWNSCCNLIISHVNLVIINKFDYTIQTYKLFVCN